MAAIDIACDNFWLGHITSWRTSGQSGAAYCRQHELVYSRFIYWRRKIDAGSMTPTTRPATSAWVPVYRMESAPTPALTVRFPGGITVEGIDERSMHLLPALTEALS